MAISEIKLTPLVDSKCFHTSSPNPKPLSIKYCWAAKMSKPILLLIIGSLLCLCITLSLPPGKLVRKG